MKKIISYAACMMMVISVAATPTSKILKAFNETFPNASNIKWSDDKELIIRFAANGAILGHRGLGSKMVYTVSATALEPLVVCCKLYTKRKF